MRLAARFGECQEAKQSAIVASSVASGTASRWIGDLFARLLPALDTVGHHFDVGVAGVDRPPGGLVRRHSMTVSTVEDEQRAFVGRKLLGDVVGIVAGQQ